MTTDHSSIVQRVENSTKVQSVIRMTKKWTTLDFGVLFSEEERWFRSAPLISNKNHLFFGSFFTSFGRPLARTLFVLEFELLFFPFVRHRLIIIALFLIEKVKNLSLIHFFSLRFSFVCFGLSVIFSFASMFRTNESVLRVHSVLPHSPPLPRSLSLCLFLSFLDSLSPSLPSPFGFPSHRHSPRIHRVRSITECARAKKKIERISSSVFYYSMNLKGNRHK